MTTELNRRKFLRTAGAAAAAGTIQGAPAILHAQNKGDKVRIAFVGVGGINDRHINDSLDQGDICAAYCDIDPGRQDNIGKAIAKLEENGNSPLAKEWRMAKGYTDYREMFDKEAKNFDAVMVGAPDHSHYPATVLALIHGKHVFTQKPLTHTVWESRQLANAMQKFKVATQMGNHGHANDGNRIIVEYVQGGFLGDIKEVHCFTNRPIWPQGIDRPAGEDPIPDGLDWEAWIGPAPMRPYKHDVYAPFKWRGWWDFGAGALGDMACHTMDSLFMSLDPGYPTAVECLSIQGAKPETFPEGSTLKWPFGPKGDRPGFEVFWYDGKNRPERPEGLEDGRELPASGNLYVGTKHTLLVTGDYGDSSRIIPEAAHKEMAAQFVKDTGKPRPPQILERSPGHHDEWRMACAGLKPFDFPGSNFSYAGPFTETILLGNVCLKFPGERLEWDGPNLRFTNNNEANDLVSKTYREGWDLKLEA